MGEARAAPRDALTVENQPSSEGPYREFGEIHRAKDEACGFDILENFERFNQANDIYCRGQWDRRLRSEKVLNWFKGMFRPGIGARRTEGYTIKDFALRNAGWMGTNLAIQRSLHLGRADGFLDFIREFSDPNDERLEVDSTREMTDEIKHVCRIFGADGVGITQYDPRWHYTNSFATKALSEKEYGIPAELPNVIVVLAAMSFEAVSTYPSATAGIAVGHGYSRDTEMVQSIATYILNLGYRAVASVNDTSTAIPYAIQAGLGEYSRSGNLITPQFGPRVRIGRIHTDLPLVHDEPAAFGVREFCELCSLCADACPPRAIPMGAPQEGILNQSNRVGVRKWSVNAETCFKFWVNQGTECGICIRVCPYNKDTSSWIRLRYYRAWKRLADSPLRRLALWLDGALGFGKRTPPNLWWKSRRY